MPRARRCWRRVVRLLDTTLRPRRQRRIRAQQRLVRPDDAAQPPRRRHGRARCGCASAARAASSTRSTLDDPRVARDRPALPGDAGPGAVPVRRRGRRRARASAPADVNDYLREAAGADFTAKDFRTWHGTRARARRCWADAARAPTPTAGRARTGARRGGASGSATRVAVCRKSYVHPRVLEALGERGRSGAAARKALDTARAAPASAPAKRRLLAFLARRREAARTGLPSRRRRRYTISYRSVEYVFVRPPSRRDPEETRLGRTARSGISDAGSVRTLTLNRPEALNSFTGAMHAELRAALDAAAADSAVRCVVLTGAGRGFCAGQDLADPMVAPDPTPGAPPKDLGARDRALYKPLALRLRSMPVPVIAAVNGVAAGAGANLALALRPRGRRRARRASSRPSPRSAWCPTTGGTWLLPRLVGRARALGLAMLGDKLPAAEAGADRPDLEVRRRRRAGRRGRRAGRAPGRACRSRALVATRQALDAAQQLDLRRGARDRSRRCSASSAPRTTTSKASPPSAPSARRASPTAERDSRSMSDTNPPAAPPKRVRDAHVRQRPRVQGLGMRVVDDRRPAAPTLDDDGARRHAQRPRDLPRRLHRHAGRLGLRLRLQLATTSSPWRRASRSTSSRRRARGDVLTARCVEVSKAGRTGVYDIEVTNQRGERIAVFRGRSYTHQGQAGRASTALPSKETRPCPSSTRARRPRADRDARAATSCARCSCSACSWTLQHAYDNVPHYRQGLRREGRASRATCKQLERPGEVPVHRQEGPARQLSVRHVRGAARAGRAHPRVVAAPPASRPWSATPQNDIDTWADLVARSIRAAGGRPGDIVHVAYGYGLFTGGLGAHYGAERARLHRDPDVGRPDREAGAADPGLQARHHHGHAVATCW